MIDLDMSQVEDPGKAARGEGGGRAAVGKAHFQLTGECEHRTDWKGMPILVQAEVLAHEDPESVGTVQKHRFPTSGGGAGFLARLLVVAGIKTDKEIERGELSFNEDDLAGRQFFGDFREETYEGKTSVRLNVYEMFALDDERAKKHPRNEGMLRRAKSGPSAEEAAGGF